MTVEVQGQNLSDVRSQILPREVSWFSVRPHTQDYRVDTKERYIVSFQGLKESFARTELPAKMVIKLLKAALLENRKDCKARATKEEATRKEKAQGEVKLARAALKASLKTL